MAKQGITIYLKEAIESGFDFIKCAFESIEDMNDNFMRSAISFSNQSKGKLTTNGDWRMCSK